MEQLIRCPTTYWVNNLSEKFCHHSLPFKAIFVPNGDLVFGAEVVYHRRKIKYLEKHMLLFVEKLLPKIQFNLTMNVFNVFYLFIFGPIGPKNIKHMNNKKMTKKKG